MAMLTPPSTIGAGPVVNLGTTDSVTVGKNVALVATSGFAIYGTGAEHEVIIDGTVVTSVFGVVLGSNENDSGNSVTVGKSGSVIAVGGSTGGIACYGADATVTNHGYIESASYGIALFSTSVDTHSTVVNTGTIIAGSRGVFRDGSNTTETIVFKNSGLLESEGDAYGFVGSGHTGRDLITNTGRMIGNIRTLGGDDEYDGRKGSLDGEILAGDGNDRLMGGKEANIFWGETGQDKLTGGRGADLLTGGLDADQFIYVSTRDSSAKPAEQDTILDFQAENDKIVLKTIDADSRAGGNQKFDFIGDDAFSGNAGELRFKIVVSDTFVYGDTNGDRKADFAIKLDAAMTLVAGDFIL
ncbi:M10 family metallopeptidase C-terminal domain-containing protein [Rhizobium sp. TH2]|uniref:calcium-binding protein n=1 Tax=Rhizobium sp. TH2 TaxID=2775403 RepID=UPI0021582427|nr:M10 family metallopeptidase C-terminal domain-containing protein [Rhizobium sp. TH2]UVC10794.1 M10 family metallopeptidase C-terminal domain-containing protein [Rhizobium sp. TH2]